MLLADIFAGAQGSYSETQSLENYVPERGLLAGVLERACRDLEDAVTWQERRGAIAWFCSKRKQSSTSFTFIEVCDILELTPSQIAHIRAKVTAAEKKNKKEVAALRKSN